MGEVLLKFYKLINEEKGLPGKIDLAIMTKIPSTVAAMAEDSQENISKFREAYKKITDKEAPSF